MADHERRLDAATIDVLRMPQVIAAAVPCRAMQLLHSTSSAQLASGQHYSWSLGAGGGLAWRRSQPNTTGG